MKKLNPIKYIEDILSHHPTTILLWLTQGIVIDGNRYIIKEFRLKDDKLYAVISDNKYNPEYFEVQLCSDEETMKDIYKAIEENKIAIKKEVTDRKNDIARVDKSIEANTEKINQEITDRTNEINRVNEAISANTAKINKEISDRTNEITRVDEAINANTAKINQEITDRQNEISRIDDTMSEIHNNALADHAEITAARGTHPNLRSRLDEVDNKQQQTAAQLAQKANKDEVTNVMTPKGTLAYASLPTSGNQVGWYYYCPDGDGTHGAGNYVWNGTSWFFGGTGDEGYNLLKEECVKWTPYKNIFNKDSTDKVDGFYINMTNGYKNINSDYSAYILPIESGSTISVSGGEGTQIGFASEYTDLSNLKVNKQVNGWISGARASNGIQVPSNAKYLFVSSNSNFLSNLQVEYNDVVTNYEPYKLVVPNTRELQEQIDNLDSSLENKVDYVQSKNIFNKDSTDKVDGFWINNTNDKAYKNINSALSIYCIPIIAGKTISISGCSSSAHYAFCSLYTNIATLSVNYSLSGYISGDSIPYGVEGLLVPENAKYLYFDTNTSWMGGVQIEYNERITSYEPYGNLIPSDEHIVKVGIGEDFQTLKEGIEYATRFNGSIVKVKRGIYDLVEEFGDELETSKGLVLKNNVHVIFEVGSKVLFNYKGDLQNVHVNFSPFNSGAYGFIIENLDLEASNCRYCIHDERGNSNDFYHNVYKNCRMKLDNANNPDWKNPQCIGTGVANGVIEIENCRFNNWITFHNNNGTSTNSKSNVYIKDCYFERGSIIVGSYGNSTEISNFYISGNSLGGNIKNQDTESTALVNIELHAWNNEIRTV